MATAELHFVLVPLLAQGHIIPMVDLARHLAARGPHVRATIVTTPVNAARNLATVDGARRAGLAVEFLELPFPTPQPEPGMPEWRGTEAIDQMARLTPPAMYLKFFKAIWNLAGPLEEYVRSLPRLPVCLVADWCTPWAATVCERLGIPRLVMHCPSAYYQLAVHCVAAHGVYDDGVDDETAALEFEVPGFPVRAVGNKVTMRGFFQYPGVKKEHRQALDAAASADGRLLNTFRGIEGAFVDAYAAALGKRAWAVGPTCSASTNGGIVHADSVVSSWLDARPPESVLYVSFGSLSRLTAKQLAVLARGLEASGRPFVWAIKESLVEIDEGFEARVRERGLLVRGWAPQVAVLSHPAVGGFLTHCGWNSALEAVFHGVPAVTWPTHADQFCNEQLVVDVLGLGVKIPAPKEGEVESGDIARAIGELMQGAARRSRAKEMAAEARAAMEEGGSSYSDLTDMIRYVTELSNKYKIDRASIPSRGRE